MFSDDPDGSAFWRRAVGPREFKVPLPKLIAELRGVAGAGKLTPAAETALSETLDAHQTGYVSVHKFAGFLGAFGPVRNCVDNVLAVVNAGWFHWYLSSAEAARLLANQPTGTFLVRFSKSKVSYLYYFGLC